MQNKDSTSIPIVILAGGQSQRLRLNGDYKWQLPFGNKTLLHYIVSKAQKQSTQIAINGPHPDQYDENAQSLSDYGLPLIHDLIPGFQGPLAGLLSSLHWAKEQHSPWVLTLACDTPFFPEDLLEQFNKRAQQQRSTRAFLAASYGRIHPVFGLWSTTLYSDLQAHIEQSENRSIMRWLKTQPYESINIDGVTHNSQSIDPFMNINTLADYQQALHFSND